MLRDIEPRPRLFQRLDELRARSAAVWIGGPAGAGKTSLAVSYIEKSAMPVVWYRIDERDQHVEELFFYLRLYAETLDGGSHAIMELPVFSPGVDLARFARRFFEALFARLPAGGLLVLDDYHSAVVGAEWQGVFERCLDSIPEGVNVFVLSRQAPPPSLARAVAHGSIGLLESAELLLSESETGALAKRRVDKKRKLSKEELSEIHNATSGWAAGVSLLLRTSPGGGLQTLAGRSAEPLFTYLTTAVFSGLSEITQKLLLHSACLGRFKLAHLEALSGASADQSELLGLYRSSFFLESDGDSEEVFRFHRLFRSFLVHRAQEVLGADGMRSLRARSAQLLQAEDRPEEAFELLAQNDDQPAMCELVLKSARRLATQGRLATLEEWLAALRPELVEASGWLSYWYATCLLASAPSRALAMFERALSDFEAEGEGSGSYLAWAGVAQALVYQQSSFQLIGPWLERFSQLEERNPVFESAEVGSAVISSLLMGLAMSGAASSVMEHWSRRAMTLAERASDPSVRLMTASVLVLNHALRGDSEPAARWLEVLQRNTAAGPAELIGSVAARAAAATLAWHQGNTAACLEAAREGLAILGPHRVPMWQMALLVFGGLAAIDSGSEQDEQAFTQRLAEIADSGAPLEISAYHVIRAHRSMTDGDDKAGLRAAELSVDCDRSSGFGYGMGVDAHTASYLQFQVGDEAGARETLRGAQQIEEAQHHPLMRCWRLWIEADQSLRGGRLPETESLLREAFVLGREKHLYNMYVPHPARVAELCRFALSRGIEPDYAREMVRRKQLYKHVAPFELPNWPWPIKIRAFGPLEVTLDDEPLALGRARLPLSLLQLLLTATGNQGIAVTRVLDTLWPDSDADKATHTFDMTVLRLRNQLGEQGRYALKVERGRVLLDATLCWTDTAAMGALLAEITALEPPLLGNAAQLHRCSALCERLETLYRGPFAEDDTLPELSEYRERLRSRVANAANALELQLKEIGGSARADALRQHLREADSAFGRH